MGYTTLEMEIALMSHFDIRRNLIVPCVTNWIDLVRFESDLVILSASNYATIIEIKVSKSDLKNDLNKRHLNGNFEYYFKGVKYFYYAVPDHLEGDALNQIPDYAGLLIVKKGSKKFTYGRGYEYDKIQTIRNPKCLFATKWTDKQRYELARLGTLRILGLKKNIQSNKELNKR